VIHFDKYKETFKMDKIFHSALFKNKVALITGGGSGIGFNCAKHLLSLSCNVVIASRDENKLISSVDKLKRLNFKNNNDNQISYSKLDIRDEDNVVNSINDVIKQHGKIDILINNGGGQFPASATEMSNKGWNAVIDTNLTGTYTMSKEVINQSMSKNKSGTIVNIAAAVSNGFAGMSHTGAARAGVINLTKSLAIECAHLGIRINAVSPGIIWSDSAARNYKDPNFLTSNSSIIPFKRLGTVDEVSSLIAFLSSDAASYISGQNFTVDGCLEIGSCLWEVPNHSSQIPFLGDTGA
jgi:peroxisomal trans-2-enoyl-CoA reductase